ncbi:MAG: flavodoxin [Ruminococcus sp.]|nr:flavodoxin [Ruminococcus sp.]
MKRKWSACLAVLALSVFSACGSESNPPILEEFADISAQTPYSEMTVTSQTGGEFQAVSEETGSAEVSGKTLIAYFSLAETVPEGADAVTYATPSIGNTEYAAMEIQKQTGGDLFAIKTVKNYPVSHSECSEIAEEEMLADERPELSSHLENMDEYDVVYIGYPIWWYAEPMAIRSFIEEYDFSGKTVIPFCTTLGAGIGKSEKNIAELADGAAVLEGITLRSERQDFGDDIAPWLTDIGMAN